MGTGLLAVKSGFILFIKSYQFPLQINTLERERDVLTSSLSSGIPCQVITLDLIFFDNFSIRILLIVHNTFLSITCPNPD